MSSFSKNVTLHPHVLSTLPQHKTVVWSPTRSLQVSEHYVFQIRVGSSTVYHIFDEFNSKIAATYRGAHSKKLSCTPTHTPLSIITCLIETTLVLPHNKEAKRWLMNTKDSLDYSRFLKYSLGMKDDKPKLAGKLVTQMKRSQIKLWLARDREKNSVNSPSQNGKSIHVTLGVSRIPSDL
ncbi:hypothetical protein AVEN_16039-1 [Araneus ventricosus]|uniref:Uncharacterized protein n=1 Tax=Araneus ventricosus TaxID=182803 RepID=A0A4Y2Q3G2_ARAVE|nr:hypothetical protein AVEN_16039-1 [Araneus ventricosus]